jgi:hypothetical protein
VSPDSLHDLCVETLLRSAEALDTIPVLVAPELDGAPERAYVNSGIPAADCPDQLVVWAAAVRELPRGGTSTEEQSAAFWVNAVEFHVQILRCLPVPGSAKKIVPATALQAKARQTNADAWALWNHLHNLRAANLFFTECEIVRWDNLIAIEPAGGAGGWELVFRAQLDGYPEVLGS